MLSELVKFAKKVRHVDKELLKDTKKAGCVSCGKKPCDPAHIKSRGAGGDDLPWNTMPLCRGCHVLQHTIGWRAFSDYSPRIKAHLDFLGWQIDPLTKKLVRS